MEDEFDCYCEWCDGDDFEPFGSCEICSVNLYPGDDDEYCDQCLFYMGLHVDDDADCDPREDGWRVVD